MLVVWHFIITAFIGMTAFFSGVVSLAGAVVFLAAGLLADVDHLIAYWYYTRDISVSYGKVKAWCFAVGYRMEHFFVFHTVWVLLALFVTKNLYAGGLVVFLGTLLHHSLDVVYDAYWFFVLKKNLRPYRRWIAPLRVLRKLSLDKYL